MEKMAGRIGMMESTVARSNKVSNPSINMQGQDKRKKDSNIMVQYKLIMFITIII